MKFRNFKMVGYVVYGRGSFNQVDEIIAPHRKEGKPMVFLVDHFFEGKPLVSRIPLRGNDSIIFADVTYEPKTTYVDKLAQQLKEEFVQVSAFQAFYTMDIAIHAGVETLVGRGLFGQLRIQHYLVKRSEVGSIYAGVPAKKIKDISAELISGEINRIADNYVKYSGWFK